MDPLGLFGFERGEVKMKVIKIGIAPQEKIRERVLAIAKGEIKPKASDPKIWFTSMRSLSQVLSDENRALLDVIRTARPALLWPYCSSFKTVCWSVLACASTAVAACCMIWVRASSVLAAA